MSSLVSISSHALDRAPSGLNERLIWLRRFGKPRLGCYGSGDWAASIEMNTNTTGATFEVKSEFNLQSPEAAVDQLIERMLSTLAKLAPGSLK